MTLSHKISLACVAVILVTCKYGSCKDNKPLPISKSQEGFARQTHATWADKDQEVFISTPASTMLINVNTGAKQPLQPIPSLRYAVWCDGGKSIIVESQNGIWWLSVQNKTMKLLTPPSMMTELTAIDYKGKRAIINTYEGSFLYDLEKMTLIKHINPLTGFVAESFDPSSPNCVIGIDTHYGKVIWNIDTDNVVKVLDKKVLYYPAGLDCQTFNTIMNENDDNCMKHLPFICRRVGKDRYLVNQQTEVQTLLPPLPGDYLNIEPSSNGTRLLTITENELTVFDIAAKSTIYRLNLHDVSL